VVVEKWFFLKKVRNPFLVRKDEFLLLVVEG
jgi:hypothetical protein